MTPQAARSTIQTDGAGVTVFKKRLDRQTRYTARFTVEYEATSYITNLTGRNHQEISGRCVAVDPGRRDMLYFVHENSTPEQPVQFRYTKQQQDDPDVVQAEQALSQQPSSTVSVEDFGRFLQARSEQSAARLSAYFNKQHLRTKFGEDAFAPHARYHEPILGLGFRRLLKKHEFQVFLIDEYKSSRCCSTCRNESLRTFRRIPNPRPYQCERYPTVVCHDFLRPAMAAPDRYRLWNRDVAACLNYLHILRGLLRNGMVPHRFRRVAVAPTRHRRRVNDQEQSRTRIRLDDNYLS
ncbi:hypothetical protein BCV72DRAFT_325082 [Rhizopus microsporus var. microsporus]|uniref:Uncharacterized protein n=1 Tax=Rhizopus microsporus var. microsporus TaxID=86635 RepID=A0A1X0R7Y4_RHIZD|nr:hypothetical protein BCV72DRAFT_325082 [Rhizopus microsporus var. microsporus]